jgi:hydroxypyruvate isomerase
MTGPNRRHALGAVAGLAGLAAAPRSRDVAAGLAGYAVNLDTWFKQAPFEQRFALARKLGFKIIEFWTVDRADKAGKAASWRKLMDDNGLTVTQFAPAWPNFADPAKIPELLRVTEQAIADARILGCTKFTVTGHALIEGMSREAQLAGYTAGLMRMAPMLEAAGMTALVEPFNRVNHLNHLLNGSQPALPMVRSVNSPRVKLLWDFYHMQLEDGDLIEKFNAGADTSRAPARSITSTCCAPCAPPATGTRSGWNSCRWTRTTPRRWPTCWRWASARGFAPRRCRKHRPARRPARAGTSAPAARWNHG